MRTMIESLRMLVMLSLLLGVAYPVAITVAAKMVYPKQAGGSLLEKDGKVVGSALFSQKTEDPKYFWPRPSAGDYATVASGASNMGPTNAALKKAVDDRAAAFRKAHQLGPDVALPADMLYASGSGLDPHISPEAARLQIDRVAAARKLDAKGVDALKALVEEHVEGPQGGLFGDPRVNVLVLNLEADNIQ